MDACRLVDRADGGLERAGDVEQVLDNRDIEMERAVGRDSATLLRLSLAAVITPV